MMWFFAILVVLVMGGVAALAAGRGTPMSPAYDDRPDALVPRTGPLHADDVRGVRFSLALRGYRMSEVDALLDRVARQLEDAEEPLGPIEPEPRADADVEDDTAGQGQVADTPAVREVRGDDPLT
jgi:DivIVA domain-containing protein